MEKQNERVSNRLISLSTSSYANFESFNQTQVATRFSHWPCMASFSIRHDIRSAKNGDTSTEAASGIRVYRKTAHRRDTETSQDPLTYTPAHTYLNISLFCWPFWCWQWAYPICLWGHTYYSITLRTAYTDIAFRALVIYRALPSCASYGRDGCDEEYGLFRALTDTSPNVDPMRHLHRWLVFVVGFANATPGLTWIPRSCRLRCTQDCLRAYSAVPNAEDISYNTVV